ncbi:uncharacterized protein LOC105013099 isoform X2 [Esox lucius]|uniref:uncharacterized protein LOC105013099 isoform X2 n=1 Tax=Esox lucius TaxID=8010 RepID=UPI001476E4B8|nr:uncharacterized protein LOC105013099 isoform X2 [Esox lucius]
MESGVMGEIEELLSEQVRRYQHLYDPSSKLYKNSGVTNNSWKEIGEILGEEPTTCQKRWKLMRDKYVRIKKKLSSRSGDSGGNKVPPYYRKLSWLSGYIKHRETDSNFVEDTNGHSPPCLEANLTSSINKDEATIESGGMAQIEELLSKQVRRYRHLYDPSSDLYKNSVVTHVSWKEIGEILGEEPATCQKRWKLMRDKYVRIKKKLSSRRADSGGNKVPPYYRKLSWLSGYIKHRETDSNLDTNEAQTLVNEDSTKDFCRQKMDDIGSGRQKIHLEELQPPQILLDLPQTLYGFNMAKNKQSLVYHLIEEVQKHPNLYDSRHGLYKSQPVMDNTWREIAEKLETDPATCKKTWRTLRDNYVKSKKIMKGCSRDPGDKHTPVILKLLSWLDQHVKHRSKEILVSAENEVETSVNEKSNKAFYHQKMDETCRQKMHLKESQQQQQQQQQQLLRTQPTSSLTEVSMKDGDKTEGVGSNEVLIKGSCSADVSGLLVSPSVPQTSQETVEHTHTPCYGLPTSATVQYRERVSCKTALVQPVEGFHKPCYSDNGLGKSPIASSYPEKAGPRLPLSSLHLLVPPLRLMSAFVWHVAQQCDVMHYGKLEEFVNTVSEMVPGLLTSRQRSQLILGLRARVVLEMFRCENPPDPQTIQNHLDGIRMYKEMVHSRSNSQQCGNELETAESYFVELVQTLLENASEREHFFKEVYPVHYGTQYDTALQTLMWTFLSRLEETLPVPNFHQAASYLHSAPSDRDDFWMSHPDAEQLKTLLQLQTQLGRLSKDTVVVSNNCLEDIIFSTLSLPQTHLLKSSQDECGELEVSPEGSTGSGVKENHEQVLLSSEVENQDKSGRDDCVNNLEDDPDSSGGVETGGCLSPQHVRKKTHICQQCGKIYCNSQVLKIHLRVHSGERPYSCSVCEKTFAQKSILARHLKMHKGDKSYLCSVCGKAFLISGELQMHMLYHTGRRPHICIYCGKTFRTSGSVKSHERWHTGERPYACSLCPMRFTSGTGLQRHKFVHNEKKPFSCFRCGKGFTQKSNMRTHLKTHQK